MKQEIDIHNWARSEQGAIKSLERKKISQANKHAILEFRDNCSIKGIGTPRRDRYVRFLTMLAETLDKDFIDATKDDIKRVVMGIQENPKYSPYTKCMYMAMVKTFYKWLKGNDEDFPDEVRWIKTTMKRSDKKLPADGDILTEDDINKLIEAAEHPRDKALVAVLYESGARVGELGSLHVGNVKVDHYGVVIRLLDGKTGPRLVRVIFSTPHIMTWLQSHPFKDDPEAPLWVNVGTTNHNKPMVYRNIADLLKRLAKKAGVKKRCSPHMFRHARASFLADHLKELQMDQYFGWVQGSGMPATYVHMNGRKIEGSILELNGMKRRTEDTETQLKPIVCPKCSTINAPGTKFCIKCAAILDTTTACEVDQKEVIEEAAKLRASKVMDTLVRDPEFVKVFVAKAKELAVDARPSTT